MARGIVGLIKAIFVAMVVIGLVGTITLQPLIQEAQDANAASKVGQPDLLDNLVRSVFQAVPLALIGGLAAVAVILQFRREGLLRGGGRRR